MWGVGLAVALVACGVAFIALGFQAQEGDRKTEAATLFKWTPKATADDTSALFLNSSTFAFAMDAPEFTSFYLWNLTNAEDLLGGGAVQPKLKQVGPYTYEKRTRKLNVNFHGIQDDAYDPNSFGAVSYQVASTYHFSSERSNGTESDLVVTLNASYVRHLTKLHAQTGRSERFLAAEFAHTHIRNYVRHLQSDFLAATKLRALRALLPEIVAKVKREGLTAVISRQRRRVGDASLPAALVRMHAVARTEQIPVMMRDVYRDQADVAIPGILTQQYALARRQAVPRVLSNLQSRLLVESVPALLDQQLTAQQMNFVPRTLSLLNAKMQHIAFPYVMQEVFDRACLEVVPFILRAIKNEIVAQDMASNQATAENAKQAVVNLWRQQGSTPTNFDAWIDNSPTSNPRTGFELLPATPALELSLEVATILLGALSSNLHFSLVDYDAAQTAADGLNGPQATAEGFAIWKQVVALNETAIAYVLDGVNNDVASVGDYLTRDQLMEVRAYIIAWTDSSVVKRDRLRFWRKAFRKRTANSELDDPDVDLDLERLGVQSGFSLQPLSAPPGATSVSMGVADQVWDASIEFSFVHPVGFTKWMSVVEGSTTVATAGLLAGITGSSSAEIDVILAWIKAMLDDGFVRRRALLHWTHGTCETVLQLPRDGGCLRYDLEPTIGGKQLGFEMNPDAVAEVASGVSEAARDALWDGSKGASFLTPAHPSATTRYYAQWLLAVRTDDFARLLTSSQQLTALAVTEAGARGVGAWLSSWTENDLNKLNVFYWWRSACWPREDVTKTQVDAPTVTTGTGSCTATPTEQQQPAEFTSTDASLLFTDVRTYMVTEETCTTTGSSFTQTQTTFTLQARVFSCTAVSTGLADDRDDGTVGFELKPPAQYAGERMSLAATIVLWSSDSALSFSNPQGYKRWLSLAAHLSIHSAGSTTETQAVVNELNAAIVSVCQARANFDVLRAVKVDASCAQVSTSHVQRVAAWVNEQSGATWVKNTLFDRWRRGVAGGLDIEPYRDGVQTGLELTAGCEATLVSLTAVECAAITTEEGTKYQVPRESLDLWDSTDSASFLTIDGYSLWDAVAVAVESGDATRVQSTQSALARICGNSGAWETWMARVFQWLQRWKSNEHLVRDVLGHWLHAQCPTTPKRITPPIAEPTPQTSTVSSCLESYTATPAQTLLDIQQLASRPVEFFNAKVAEEAALVRSTKTIIVNEAWTKCERLTATTFTKTVGTRRSNMEFQACNLLSILATPAVDTSQVTHKDATFELNATATISLEVAQELWNSLSTFSLLKSTSFMKNWYPAIDRSTALQTVQRGLNAFVTSSSSSDVSVLQSYLKQWEKSDAAAVTVASLWITTNAASVDVDIYQAGDQRGFELSRSVAYKALDNSLALPTLVQAQTLWKTDSAYSIVRNDDAVDDTRLPMGFRAWAEMYEGVDYESEQLVAQYPPKNEIARPMSVTHALNASQHALLLTAMTAATTLTEAQVRGIARWLFNWATDDSLRDFVLAQWAKGETFRGDSQLNLDLAPHVERLFAFPVTSGMKRDLFTAASPVLAGASRVSLRKLWDVTTAASLLNPASRIAWCLVNVTDGSGAARAPCAHLLDGYGVLLDSAFDEFVALVQPSAPNTTIAQTTANLSALALSFLTQALSLTSDQLLVVAKWYRQVPESSLFFQVYQLNGWSAAYTQVSKDPLELGFQLAFVLPWTTAVARNVSVRNLVPNVAYVGASRTKTTIGECSMSLSLLYTLWDASNPVSFLHPTGSSTWLSYARAEINETKLVGSTSSTAQVIDDQQLTADTVSCVFQLVGHWLKSWSSHPSARLFVEEFWIAPITQGPASIATLLPSASDTATAFPLDALTTDNQRDPWNFSTTEWWVAAARVLLNVEESVAMIQPEKGFALWKPLLVACFSSDRISGKCKAPDTASQYEATSARALQVLSRALLNRIVAASPALSNVSDDLLLPYTESMVQQQVVPWLLALLDHSVLEQYVTERVATGPLVFTDLAAVQFVNGSVTGANFIVHDASTGLLILNDTGTRSERSPRKDFVFDAVNGVVPQQSSSFLPGFGELLAFCSESGRDRQFAYDEEPTCSIGTDYTLSIRDARSLWTAFGYDDTTEWNWPAVEPLGSGVPSPSPLPPTPRSALVLDAFLAQPFWTVDECEALMEPAVEAYANDWSALEKQHICVDRTGAAGVRAKTVYLELPALKDLNQKSISFVRDLQAYLRYTATRFMYEPNTLGLSPRPPREETALPSSLTYPIGGYFAAMMVSQILFASKPSEAGELPTETPLWANATTTERGAWTFELAVPLEDDAALYRKTKSIVGRLLAADGSKLMNAWGEDVEFSAVRVTDGSQFTTAVLTGQTENSVASIEFPPQKLYFYWGYARRLAQLTFDSNTTRFGVPLMRYMVNWTLPSRLPTGILTSAATPSTPSLNVTFLYDDLPLLIQSSSSLDSASSVVDVDPRTGSVLHRRLVWQITAQVGDRRVLDVWHKALAAGWLPVVWIQEEASASATTSTAMINLGPFTPKTLAIVGIAGGFCVVAVGCVVGIVSLRRARLVRMQRFHSIAPDESVSINGGDGLKETSEAVHVSNPAMQVMLDQTEGIEDVGQEEIRTV
ncbi:Protein croquemort [Phytophthora citrophthora]|uniref:Protein croquemort n=1 Tax=Phytophthora citrophthora TaxID=4793 RepID=A0AAD9G0T9_9STRA|nr:Protein croquemort [Phytophthora citrophthora]